MEQCSCVQVSGNDLLRGEGESREWPQGQESLRGEGNSRRVWTNPMRSLELNTCSIIGAISEGETGGRLQNQMAEHREDPGAGIVVCRGQVGPMGRTDSEQLDRGKNLCSSSVTCGVWGQWGKKERNSLTPCARPRLS